MDGTVDAPVGVCRVSSCFARFFAKLAAGALLARALVRLRQWGAGVVGPGMDREAGARRLKVAAYTDRCIFFTACSSHDETCHAAYMILNLFHDEPGEIFKV